MKRLIAGITALFMVSCIFPMNTLAATYTVSNAEEMSQSWEAASANTDQTNYFEMSSSVDMSGHILSSTENKVYEIGAAAGTDSTISHVNIAGSGAVNIHTDVTGTDDTALWVDGNVDVTVTGDVSVSSQNTNDDVSHAVITSGGADVLITGDVRSQEGGIHVYESSVHVAGDITLENQEPLDGENHVIWAMEDSTVKVEGDVASSQSGVYAMGDVAVSGNLTTNGQTTIVGSEGRLLVEEDMVNNPGDDVNGVISGVFVADGAALAVMGNLETPSLYVTENGYAGVNGTVTGQEIYVGTQGNEEDCSTFASCGISTQNGIIGVSGSSDMTVYGDVAGALEVYDNATADIRGSLQGDHVYVEGSRLEVDVNVDAPTVYAVNDAHVVIGGYLTSEEIRLGIEDDWDDTSTISVGGIKSTNGFTVVSGFSKLTVFSHMDSYLMAQDRAQAVVSGSLLQGGKVYEDAVISFRVAYEDKTDTLYNPDHVTEEEALCKGYAPGSELYRQVQGLTNLLAEMSRELSDELDRVSLTLASIFQADQIAADTLSLPKYFPGYNFSAIHPNSPVNQDGWDFVLGYQVSMYQDLMHDLFKEIPVENYPTLQQKADIQDSLDICAEIFCSASGEPNPQWDYLNAITRDGEMSPSEAEAFLIQYKGYSPDSPDLDHKVQELCDMYRFFLGVQQEAEELEDLPGLPGKAGDINTFMDILFGSAELADFWFRNYQSQVVLLDNMLSNQVMSPEMTYGLLSLRQEYMNKFIGSLNRIIDFGKGMLVDAGESVSPLFCWAQFGVETYGFISGTTDISGEMFEAAAYQEIAPQLMLNFQNSIQNIKNGDSSQEALDLLEANYDMLLTTLQNMCEIMADLGNEEQCGRYTGWIEELEDLEIGDSFHHW